MSEERKPMQKSPLSHILSDSKTRIFSEKHLERPDFKAEQSAPESAVVTSAPDAAGLEPSTQSAPDASTQQKNTTVSPQNEQNNSDTAAEEKDTLSTEPATEQTTTTQTEQKAATKPVNSKEIGLSEQQNAPQFNESQDLSKVEANQEPQAKQEESQQDQGPQEPKEVEETKQTQETDEPTENPPKETEAAVEQEEEPLPPSKRIKIDSSNAIEAVSGLKRYVSSVKVYYPGVPLFDGLEDHLNSTVWVRIARRYLTRTNERVEKRCLWGTDVYTDDSDVVAALFHGGYLDPESEDETIKNHASGTYDLMVAVTLLPKLLKYTGCFLHELNSRSWGSFHDGISFKIDRISELPRGTAEYPQEESLGRAKIWSMAYFSGKNEPKSLRL